MVCLLAVAAFGAAPAGATTGATTPQVAIGYYHLCSLDEAGIVTCIGENSYGEVNNSVDYGHSPATVADLGGEKATQIAASFSSTCALLESGVVKCWGRGDSGELGDGNMNNSALPVTTDLGGARAVSIGGGENTFCALLYDGTVKCWGDGFYGQLGNGVFDNSPTPVSPYFGKLAATSLSVGWRTACVTLSDNSASCWGRNNDHVVSPSASTSIADPTPIDIGGASVQAIAVDYNHACALLQGGTVRCWGDNYSGQLGDGTTNDSSSPIDVDFGGEAVAAVDVGWEHSCARLVSGEIKCWGDNYFGALGLGESVPNSLTPTAFNPGDASIKSFVADKGATCVVLASGAPKCTGGNIGYMISPDGSGPSNLFLSTLIFGSSALPSTPAGPTPIAGTIVKPSWKLKRAGSKLTASATLEVTAAGMDASHCVGDLQVSVPPKTTGASGSTGSGKVAAAPTFALSYKDGKCTAAAKRTVPMRVAKNGLRLRVQLKNPTLLTAPSVTSTTKLPKS